MLTPYPSQVEATEAAIKHHRGAIVMPTGAGKSVAMVLLIEKLQVRTLVIVPNLELKRQLSETFMRYFGSLENITIENIDSRSLPKHTDYGCLIIDEAHHSAAATYRKLNVSAWKSIYYRFFFTATAFRSREEEQILYESVAGQVIYRLDYRDAVEANMICPLEAYYIDLPIRNVKSDTWQGVYKELIVDNKERNELLSELLAKIHVSGASTLCLVKEIKHGNNLTSLTGGAFANGQDGESTELISAFNVGKLKTLIGTTGVLGEGVDTKPAEYIIIAGLGKSKNAFMQQVGRGFRRYEGKESCKIIIFRDASHKWSLAHFKAQCKILRDEYGIRPVKLEV